MGVHIAVHKLIRKEEGDYGDTYWITEEHPTWDTIRYSGDKEFINDNLFEPVDESEPDYVRPLHFGRAKQWADYVESHNKPLEPVDLPRDNFTRKRFLDILEEMENDPNLTFKFCW